jgi:hypothetical protein
VLTFFLAARYVFDALVALLVHASVSVRQRVLHYLSTLRADGQFLVSLMGQRSCIRIAQSLDTSKSELNLTQALENLTKQAKLETSRPALMAIFLTIQEWLWNRFVLRGVALDALAALICGELKEGKLPEPFRGSSQEALELVKTILQIALLLVSYADQFRQGTAFVLELGRTFHHLLRFPFAGGVFDAAGRAALQRLCLQGLCSVAAHMPDTLCPLPPTVVESVCNLVATNLLEEHVPQTLDFLSRFPAFVAALSKTQIANVLEALVLSSAKRSVSVRFNCFKTTVAWLACVPATDRPVYYNRILPHLLGELGGPSSVLAEAVLDWMANVVFLDYAPDRSATSTAHERFGFAGRPTVAVVQGNCLMEIVTGVQGWSLVTVRRPCGRVSWITRLLNDFHKIVPPVLNRANEAEEPQLHSYSTLFRSVNETMTSSGGLPALPALASGVLAAPLISSSLVLDSSVGVGIRSPEATTTSRRGTLSSPLAGIVHASPGGATDLPPLNPKGALEKKLPKPEFASYESESLNDQTPPRAVEDSASAEEEEDTDLRMAALFSYNEGDDLEEERDVFFAAHSFTGSRAHSMGSSTSVSPPHKALPIEGRTLQSAKPRLRQHSEPELYLQNDNNDSNISTNNSNSSNTNISTSNNNNNSNNKSNNNTRGRTMSDSTLESPLGLSRVSGGSAVDAVSSASPLKGQVSAANGAPPHASLLFLQMRYVPFSDNQPIRLPSNNAALSRALSVLDYMPSCGTHKIGLLFVAKGQKTEAEIFANQRGSVAYSRFVRSLGDAVRLKGYRGYAGGLDTVSDTDGEYSVRFADETVDLMIHCATMMPAGNVLAKKRHVGNDHVLLVEQETELFFIFCFHVHNLGLG